MSDDLERLAAALWKAQATDTGTPQSVIDARTPEAFADESPQTRETWRKFARAALAEMGGVRVKPLEWLEHQRHLESGPYQVCCNGSGSDPDAMWRVRYHGKVICPQIKGVDRAVSWANDHHEARILAAIEPAPVSEMYG